jgi:hypothetical protein
MLGLLLLLGLPLMRCLMLLLPLPLLLIELPLQLAVVVNELAQQCSCLQRMVRAGALTQSETATDGQPVTSPNALC